MGITLNLGISKKIGLPDYGSAGSSCNVEIELDASALDHPDEFHRRVREAYAACRAAVEDELGNHRTGAKPDTRPTPPPKTEYRNSPPPEYRNSAPSSERNDNRFPVSPKQLTFIGQLSKGIKGLTNAKLDEYCQTEFGKISSQLSSQEASKLIDALKDAKARKEGLA